MMTSEAPVAGEENDRAPLLRVEDLSVEFDARGAGGRRLVVSAVDHVSFHLDRAETLGIVGETGCGKTTLARSIVKAVKVKGGSVVLDGEELMVLRGQSERSTLRRMQMIFQDPYSSMDPKWRVRKIIREALSDRPGHSDPAVDARVDELLGFVGLDPKRHSDRVPRELSGGECQRVAIARAIAAAPDLIICDEAVSSLDVSIQAQILNLFLELRRGLDLACLFIAHDLTVVKHLSDRVAVMYLGRFAEVAPSEALYAHPFHPYTDALLSAVPSADVGPQRTPMRAAGEPASPINPPSGCRYRTRCPLATDLCAAEAPPLREVVPGRQVACHFPLT